VQRTATVSVVIASALPLPGTSNTNLDGRHRGWKPNGNRRVWNRPRSWLRGRIGNQRTASAVFAIFTRKVV